MKKLLLCSGDRSQPYGADGWFRVDEDPRVEPDLITRIPPLPARVVANAPWDRVALIHGIEHMYSWDALDLLKSIHGILADDGILILEQPNLEKVVGHLDDPEYFNALYGDPLHRKPQMMHRYGYTPKLLARFVLGAGFEKAVVRPALFHKGDVRDFRMEAMKHA